MTVIATTISPRGRVRLFGPADVAIELAEAARIVPPLWPLDGAIAVNPLSGFEHLPFAEAIGAGAELFGARTTMRLAQWRGLVDAGRIDRKVVHEVAVERLGGFSEAFAHLGPDVTPFDLLCARLFDLPEPEMEAAASGRAALLVAKWCAAFFDRGAAAAPMPDRERGLHAAVLALLPHDPDFRALAGSRAGVIADWPTDALAAVAAELERLAVAPDERRALLRRLIARLPGWAGHLRWRTDHADAHVAAGAPATMADLVALLLLVDRAAGARPAAARRAAADPARVAKALAAHRDVAVADLGPAVHRIAAMSAAELGLVFQTAAERAYRDGLMARLSGRHGVASIGRPAAQFVFCIDVRSEPFRRALEAQGAYETFGYAGFFGLPIATHRPHHTRRHQLPALLAPQHDVALVPEMGEAARVARERHAAAARDLFAFAKGGAATGFATAEAVGPFAGLAMLANGVAPRWVRRLAERTRPALKPVCDAHGPASGLSLAERVAYARALFALTGMRRATAPVVVLAGHAGRATNNPYAAALDCGACGGHGGGDNARLMAAILNDPEVRTALAEDGEPLPEDTVFVAAEHCTTTDRVTLFETGSVPLSHWERLQVVEAALARAGAANRARRAAALGRAPEDLAVGAAHWGEVRAEWGLAGNAAFIVGPRTLTRDVDLEGRAFLHSYDWRADPEGEALETILTAPMVVAQWINCQYLFSTIDPERYGAGDKPLHNPVGRLGVLRGNEGDLCVGLPLQSLFDDDGRPQHVPQRLLTVVQAPLHRVEAVVDRQAVLRRLFGNGWVQLVVIDPATGKAHRWRADAELEQGGSPAPTGPGAVPAVEHTEELA